jgi:hypothetical protein
VLPQAARTFQVRLRLRRLAQSENMRNHCSFNFFTGPKAVRDLCGTATTQGRALQEENFACFKTISAPVRGYGFFCSGCPPGNREP